MSGTLSPAFKERIHAYEGWKARSSCKLQNMPRPPKNSPLPLKRAEPAQRIKVGGEAAPFPLRHPFRFHARRFPNVPALRCLPPTPTPSGLSPAAPTGGTSRGDPGRPAGADGKAGPRQRRGRSGGRGGGRGRAPSQRPPARGTQPLSVASRAHKPRRRRWRVTTPRAPRPRPTLPIGRRR